MDWDSRREGYRDDVRRHMRGERPHTLRIPIAAIMRIESAQLSVEACLMRQRMKKAHVLSIRVVAASEGKIPYEDLIVPRSGTHICNQSGQAIATCVHVANARRA